MRTLLLILGLLSPSTAETDPCVNHKVLNDAWRSIDCTHTQYSNGTKSDNELKNEWYRFNSSGGWKMPETAVPAHHCSTEASGWLNATHPTESQGKTHGTVCFNWNGNLCHWTERIKIQNCSSYFVYFLKKTKEKHAYCTVAESGDTDPCVFHNVLVQPWRSLNCSETECTGKAECDVHLKHGWYRFKSSGGWKMAEVVVPPNRCSTRGTAWLQGSHPTMADGEVTRRVCINWERNQCYWIHEIKIKNCSSFFVYELKALHQCAAYCTDPNTTEHENNVIYSTQKPTGSSSSNKAVTAETDPNTTEHENNVTYSTQKPTGSSSSNKAVTAETDPNTTEHENNVTYSTQKPTGSSSSNKAVTAETDPNTTEHGDDTTYSTQKQTESSSSNRAVTAGTESTSPATEPTTECKQADTPVMLDLSEEECEHINAHVQVMYVGRNKLDTPEKQTDYLEKVQMMLKDHLPCKNLLPKLEKLK
ncbi:pancreatic secretory granule membrane major glycoprotein GP2-like [Chiloscyllium punctatum]|uniref:pancreatic secretory granule membrane major glycoprotein GP2-like n=1 Tax=Chiloscyllium punctatum TaxID=137246 RepID=UPI003B63549A